MQLRTAALVGLLGIGLGWAAGSRMPSATPADGPSGRGSSGPRPLGVNQPARAEPFTEQLRLRLERQPNAPHPSRNPFVFGARPAVRPDADPGAPPAAAAPALDSGAAAAPEAPPPGSQFRLTGMATTVGPGGPEYTAIVHDGRALVFVKRGDTLPGGFEAVEIQESSVTLRDSTGGERTLRLR